MPRRLDDDRIKREAEDIDMPATTRTRSPGARQRHGGPSVRTGPYRSGGRLLPEGAGMAGERFDRNPDFHTDVIEDRRRSLLGVELRFRPVADGKQFHQATVAPGDAPIPFLERQLR